MSFPEKVTTLRSLAKRLGLSTMTVSRALRNTAGISPETRERVLAAVRKFKYTPDPALGVLNAYRHGRRLRSSFEPLAYITNFAGPESWRTSGTFVRYFDGALRQATRMGYQLVPFWLGEPGLTDRRASNVLKSRGIRGVIIGPLTHGKSELRLDWSGFSAVALGRSLGDPAITAVSTNHFQAVQLAVHHARRLKYRRIGFALTGHEDLRTLGTLRASFLLSQTEGCDLLPPLLVSDFSQASVAAWAACHRPDLLISSEQTHHDLLVGDAPQPGHPAFLHLNVHPSSSLSGIDQSHDVVGEHAVALLHSKLTRSEFGPPPQRETLLLDAIWKDGRGPTALRMQNTLTEKPSVFQP